MIGRLIILRRMAPTLLLTTVMVSRAPAQVVAAHNHSSSVTLYGGERFGGSVTDSTTDATADLNAGPSFAAVIDIGLDDNRQIEFFYSQQTATLNSHGPRLTLHNYQFGGTNFIDEIGRGVYVMAGVGGTTVTAAQSDVGSETFFSGNLGVGWMIPLGARIGLRFEARGYGIFLNSSGAVFCGANMGCKAAIRSNALFEGEVLGGLSVRF